METPAPAATSPASFALQPAERRLVSGVAAIAVLRMFGLFMLLPVLALWAAGLDGATPWLIGLAVGGYGVTQAALQLPFGALSDRIGRRPVIVAGLAVFVLGSAVAAGADTILTLIVGRVLQGAGAISSTLTALLADATREHVRLRATAVLGISIGAGFLLALAGGPLLASVMSVRAMFAVSAGCGLLAIALTLTLPRSERPPGPGRAAAGGIGPGVVSARLLRLNAAVLLLHLTLTALFVLLPFVLRDTAGLAPARHWLFHAGAIVASLGVALPLLLRWERAAPRRLPAVAMLLCAAGCLLMAAAPASLPLLFAGALLYFAGFNYLEAGLPAWVSLAAPAERRGAAMGVFASAQFLGAFLGGVLAGALRQTLSDPAGFVALALAGLVGFAVLVRDR